MKIKNVMLAIGLASSLSGCASMMSGTTQSVHIDSNPPGAKILVGVRGESGGVIQQVEIGVTPMDVVVMRKDGVVVLEKAGYKSVEVPMETSMNSWVWGDIALGSLLSTSIDTSTGAANEFDPGEYVVELDSE